MLTMWIPVVVPAQPHDVVVLAMWLVNRDEPCASNVPLDAQTAIPKVVIFPTLLKSMTFKTANIIILWVVRE